MSRFAPIAPLRIYRQMLEAGILGIYHMLLAHEVAEDLEGFSQVFNQLKGTETENTTASSDHQIILDNGTVELGHPMPASTILAAVEAVNPTYVILPDILRDRRETLTHIYKAVGTAEWRSLEGKYMLCPQGNTEHDILKCARNVIKLQGIPIALLGVGRWTANAFGTRKRLIEWLTNEFPDIPIHVLGFSENIADDIECARMPNVIGIDSARPILLGLENIEITTDDLESRPHRETSEAWASSAMNEMMIHNLEVVRNWIEE